MVCCVQLHRFFGQYVGLQPYVPHLTQCKEHAVSIQSVCSDCHDQQHKLQISKGCVQHVYYSHKHSLDLLQVLALLGQDRASADPETADLCLGYSTTHMAIYAACVGSYLTDLLHMRHLDCSPMSAQDPDTFLKACQGV